MILQKQPNHWSCLPTAYAMAIEIPVQELIYHIGHDGSLIVWPRRIEPYNRRGFHPQEVNLILRHMGYICSEFEPQPQLSTSETDDPIMINHHREFENILKVETGVLIGKTLNGQRHAVAWDTEKIYNPNGTIHDIEQFHIQSFIAIIRVSHLLND